MANLQLQKKLKGKLGKEGFNGNFVIKDKVQGQNDHFTMEETTKQSH